MNKQEYLRRMAKAKTPQEAAQVARDHADRPYTLAPRYDHSFGPMYYFGQRVCVAMERIGQPTVIHTCYRSAQDQNELAEGVTNAAGWESPHQFYEAVDLVHRDRGWPPEHDPYWIELNATAQNVAADLGLPLVGGYQDWQWDFAHFEHEHWRSWAKELRRRNGGAWRSPTEAERIERFREVLPHVALNKTAAQTDLSHVDDALQRFDLWQVERRTLAERLAAKMRDLRDFF